MVETANPLHEGEIRVEADQLDDPGEDVVVAPFLQVRIIGQR